MPRRRVLIGAGVALAVAVLIGIAWLVRDWVLLRAVRAAARSIGVDVRSADVLHLGTSEVELTDVDFELAGAPSVHGHASSARAPAATPPRRLAVDGLDLVLGGAPATWLDELGRWSRANPDAFAVELHASNVKVSAVRSDGAAPWLTLQGATLENTKAGARLDARSSALSGAAFGPASLTWLRDGARATFVFGDSHAPWCRGEARPSGGGADVDAKLGPAPLADVATRLGLKAPPRATLRGELSASLRRSGADAATLRVTVDGWVPPHPKELDGIIYGKSTRLAFTARARDATSPIALEHVEVGAGALDLKGGGTLSRRGPKGPHLTLDLAGALPCGQVARSAATNLGGVLGGVLAGIGEQALEGVVHVALHVEGDVADLHALTVRPDVRPDCSL